MSNFKKKPHLFRFACGANYQVEKKLSIPSDLHSSVDVSYVKCAPSDKYPELPPPVAFSLCAQRDAGVPLKRLNSVVFNKTSVDAQDVERLEEIIKDKEDVEPEN